MKKGVINAVHATNNKVGFLFDGTVVFNSTANPIKVGSFVTYEPVTKTQKYVKDEQGNNVIDPATGKPKLEADTSGSVGNQIRMVFESAQAYAEAAAKNNTVDVLIKVEASKVMNDLAAKYNVAVETLL